MADYFDSKNYHIQYHSFEHLDLMKLSWLRELEIIVTESSHKEWVNLRLQKSTQPAASGYAGSSSVMVEKPLPILENSELLRIAKLWHDSLGTNSQGVDRLMLRLVTLNDLLNGNKAISELMYFRSIASFDESYGVIHPGLDIQDHWQPLDVFYDSIQRNPGIAAEIRAFKLRTGLSWVGNPDSRDGHFLGLSGAQIQDARKTFNKIIELAETDPNPEGVFKNTADLPKFVTLFTVSGSMIFQFRYNVSTYCL